MEEILQKIDKAKHVEIVVESEFLTAASALYTHVLRLHKKVSLVCRDKNIGLKYSFLPWFEKIKSSVSSSADLSIVFLYSSLELYKYFKINNIKINPKMATALYAGILEESHGFMDNSFNGMNFAAVGELIECGADYKLCNKFIIKRTTLSVLRLKALMLKDMILLNSAKAAIFSVCESDLKSTGASFDDAKEIMNEAFGLEYVEIAILLNSDAQNEVIKLKVKEI